MHSSVFLAALAAFAAVAVSANTNQDEPFAESEHDILYRVARGARGRDRGGGPTTQSGRTSSSGASSASGASYGRVQTRPSVASTQRQSPRRGHDFESDRNSQSFAAGRLGWSSPQRERKNRTIIHGTVVGRQAASVGGSLHAARRPSGRGRTDAKTEECRYKKEPWGECDNATNTQKRRLLLKRGSGTCEPTKEVTRTCKKACRYEKGTWNSCDTTSNVRTRMDRLKPKSDQSCDQTRTITKKCKNAPSGCRYNRSTRWSECDTKTGTKRKVMPLVNGSPPDCESYKTVTKPCRAGRGRKNKQDEEEEDED